MSLKGEKNSIKAACSNEVSDERALDKIEYKKKNQNLQFLSYIQLKSEFLFKSSCLSQSIIVMGLLIEDFFLLETIR